MDNPSDAGAKHHRRNRSAVLKSMIKRPSSHEKQAAPAPAPAPAPYNPHSAMDVPLLPPDHPHANGRVLSEISPHRNTPQPRRAYTEENQRPKGLHKKTKSAVSLRSLGRSKESKSKDDLRSGTLGDAIGSDINASPKKKKSVTGLGAMFKSRNSRVEEHSSTSSNKENTTPVTTPQESQFTPIYAAFATQPQEASTTTKVPLNDHERQRSMIEDIALYDPKVYDGSKQRNFGGYAAGSSNIVRPKSEVIADNELSRFLNPRSRKSSDVRRPQSCNEGSQSKETAREPKYSEGQSSRKNATHGQHAHNPSRVKAAVERINRRTIKSKDEKPEDLDKFQAEFEAMLEARNIPEIVRDRMRTLELHVKQEFLRAYEQDQTPARGHSSGSDGTALPESNEATRPSSKGDSNAESALEVPDKGSDGKSDSKKSRPRSRTFTFKKGDKSSATTSPAKKQKTDILVDTKHASHASLASPNLSSTSPGPARGSSFLGLKKTSAPNDFVTYLQKHRLPTQIEVGKLHKMRQLLRNETLPWVHEFIELGGMMELVTLLHRLMEIEWREERDDQLLNEALLCLKALCTTDLALQKLCEVETELFPALLSMLFDKEHRGPSEFATRQIIVTILLAHLEAATRTPTLLPRRAKTILGYLTDRENADKRNHLPFDLEVGPKRPYKFWNKEISNVTKEVFWVWLHPLNVIPYPRLEVQEESTGCLGAEEHPTVRKCPPPRHLAAEPYTSEFFPRPRPPVPAAPYIGGVEWDATNYLASHIDLLNGLIASLPSRDERNALRAELRASGLERTMGEKLRQCKEKYYGAVHDVLKTWVAAAVCDGWDAKEVRMGPPKEELSPRKTSPKKSPAKKKLDLPPQLDAPPMLQLSLGLEKSKADSGEMPIDAWDDILGRW